MAMMGFILWLKTLIEKNGATIGDSGVGFGQYDMYVTWNGTRYHITIEEC